MILPDQVPSINVTLVGETTRLTVPVEVWTVQVRATGKLASARGFPESSSAVMVTLKGVSAVDVDAGGLMDALGDLAENTQRLSGIACTFVCDLPVPMEDNDTATELFYIAQEAISNAVEHARATHVIAELAADSRQLRLWISDDGVGPPRDADQVTGMGLHIMRHSATLLGGSLRVQAAEDGGTLVTCTIDRKPDHEPECSSTDAAEEAPDSDCG